MHESEISPAQSIPSAVQGSDISAYLHLSNTSTESAFREAFHQKRLQAFLVKHLIPAYQDLSIDEITGQIVDLCKLGV